MVHVDDSRFFDANRLKDLGDGIFAFAMTFLIVTMDLPRTSAALLNEALIKMIPDVLTYIISFFLLAIFWMTNHINLKDVKRADSRLVWISILLLLTIVFVPLTSDIYALYDGALMSIIIFNLNIGAIGLVFMLQWHHLVANSLHHEAFTKEEIRDRYYLYLLLIATSMVAIGVGLFYPLWSPIVYVLMFSYRVYLRLKWTKTLAFLQTKI